MKVREMMTKQTAFCGLETSLAEAVERMVKHSCGFLPVVGEGGNVITVITDRDISVALGTRNEKASKILVRDVVMPRHVKFLKLFACTPEDDIHTVLKTMGEARVHRVPVVDREGALLGILSIDDIALQACERAGKQGISCKDVIQAYKEICRHDQDRAARPAVA